MLDARADIVLLNTSDIGTSGLTSHYGILRVVLEVTSAEGVTHDVQGRSQQHVGTIFLHLFADGLTNLLHELGVPGRGEQGTDGEVCAVIGGIVTFTGSVDTESGRTVSEYDGRDAERVERIGGTSGTRHKALGSANDSVIAREAGHTCSDDEVGLVFERHLGHHFLLVEGLLYRSLVCCSAGCEQACDTKDHNGFLHKTVIF